MANKKVKLSVVDNEIDEDEDDFDLDEDDEEDFEDEDEDVEDVIAEKPKRRGSKRTPPPAPPSPTVEETFEQALGAANEPSRSPVLGRISDDGLVIELTELILTGDDSEMTSMLVPTFTGPRGPKIAKKLVREARDRAIAKLKRVADVACVNIDTFMNDD